METPVLDAVAGSFPAEETGCLAANDERAIGVFEASPYPGDSLFGDFVSEIDAWARQALAANGFGD